MKPKQLAEYRHRSSRVTVVPRRREEAEERDEEESQAGKELQQLAVPTGNQFTGSLIQCRVQRGKKTGEMTDFIFKMS